MPSPPMLAPFLQRPGAGFRDMNSSQQSYGSFSGPAQRSGAQAPAFAASPPASPWTAATNRAGFGMPDQEAVYEGVGAPVRQGGVGSPVPRGINDGSPYVRPGPIDPWANNSNAPPGMQGAASPMRAGGVGAMPVAPPGQAGVAAANPAPASNAPYRPQPSPFPAMGNAGDRGGIVQRPAGMAGPTNTGIRYSPGPSPERLASRQTRSARPAQVVPQAAGTPGPYAGSMYGAGGTLFMTPDLTDPQFGQPQAMSQQQRDAAFFRDNPQALQRQMEDYQQRMAGIRQGGGAADTMNQRLSPLQGHLNYLQSFQGAGQAPRTVNFAPGSRTMPSGGSVTYGGAPVTARGTQVNPNMAALYAKHPGMREIMSELNGFYSRGESGPTNLTDDLFRSIGMPTVGQMTSRIQQNLARGGR